MFVWRKRVVGPYFSYLRCRKVAAIINEPAAARIMSKFSEMFLSRGHYTNWQHSLKVFGRLRLQKTNFKISKQQQYQWRYFETKDLKLLSVSLKPFSMNSSQGRRRTTKAFVQNNLEKNQEKKDIIVAIVQYLICMVGPAGRPAIVQYKQ